MDGRQIEDDEEFRNVILKMTNNQKFGNEEIDKWYVANDVQATVGLAEIALDEFPNTATRRRSFQSRKNLEEIVQSVNALTEIIVKSVEKYNKSSVMDCCAYYDTESFQKLKEQYKIMKLRLKLLK